MNINELRGKLFCLMTSQELSHMNKIVLYDRQIQSPPFVYYPVSDRWDILVNIIEGSQYVGQEYRERRVKMELEYWDFPKTIYEVISFYI